jgi:proliferating cell nuclear antigen PCNA
MSSEIIFEAKTIAASDIKVLFESIKFLGDCLLSCNNQGIKLIQMNPNKQVLVYLHLLATNFQKYYIRSEISIPINLVKLFKVLKNITSGDIVIFQITEEYKNYIGIRLENLDKNYVKEFYLPMQENNFKNLSMKDFEPDYTIELPTSDFQKYIRDITLINGKHVIITSVDKQLTFKCDDGECIFSNTITQPDDTIANTKTKIVFKKHSDIPIESKYKLEYFTLFTRATHLGAIVNLYITDRKPVIIEYFFSLGVIRFIPTPIM